MKGKEQKWIRAVLYHNSQDAANKLVAAYYDEIYAYVYRQVGNKEDALDLTQEQSKARGIFFGRDGYRGRGEG